MSLRREMRRPVTLGKVLPVRELWYRDINNQIVYSSSILKVVPNGVILKPFANDMFTLIPWSAVVSMKYRGSDTEIANQIEVL